MTERVLITKIVRTSPTTCDLYAQRHRYPDLKCFDLALLQVAGIDPQRLPTGEPVPVAFYAVWQYGEKVNSKGHLYRDLLAVEPMTAPATVASSETSALLQELRGIRALLSAWIVDAMGLKVPEQAGAGPEPDPAEPDQDAGGQPPPEAVFPRFGDGSPVSDAALPYFEKYQAAEGRPPADVAALRVWVRSAE